MTELALVLAVPLPLDFEDDGDGEGEGEKTNTWLEVHLAKRFTLQKVTSYFGFSPSFSLSLAREFK